METKTQKSLAFLVLAILAINIFAVGFVAAFDLSSMLKFRYRSLLFSMDDDDDDDDDGQRYQETGFYYLDCSNWPVCVSKPFLKPIPDDPEPSVCGDGIVQPEEVCDDAGAQGIHSSCSDDCRYWTVTTD